MTTYLYHYAISCIGYYKNKEETANTVDAEGWLHTGDIGYIDDDGDVFIVDRIKELIKYKGFQVSDRMERETTLHCISTINNSYRQSLLCLDYYVASHPIH